MTQLATSFKTQDDRLYVGRSQDCTAIAEYAKALHNEGYHGSSEMKHAAKIPLVIVEKYCNERGITFEQFMGDDKHIKAVVENPDNSVFRIWKGRL
jgi:hypothetical protein